MKVCLPEMGFDMVIQVSTSNEIVMLVQKEYREKKAILQLMAMQSTTSDMFPFQKVEIRTIVSSHFLLIVHCL